MTFQGVSPTRSKKMSSNRNKCSFTRRVIKNNTQESCPPLLPEITGIRVGSQAKKDEILTNGGQIQVEELWTTEALIDKLESWLIQVKEPNSTGSSFYNRKYLNCATAIITNWSKVEQNKGHHQFVFFLSDILPNNDRLAAELIDLSRTAPSTLAYVLHKVVQRLFEMVSAGWFYQSAAEEIQVRIDP
jgi:hypothetical protein